VVAETVNADENVHFEGSKGSISPEIMHVRIWVFELGLVELHRDPATFDIVVIIDEGRRVGVQPLGHSQEVLQKLLCTLFCAEGLHMEADALVISVEVLEHL
jgi:hypothetical protein